MAAPPAFDDMTGPWNLPRMEFTIYAGDAEEAFLADLETRVPGALTWAVPEGWKPPYKKRLKKLLEEPAKFGELPPISHYIVQVPLTGAWLVEDALNEAGGHFIAEQRGDARTCPDDEEGRAEALSAGCRLVTAARNAGFLTDEADVARPFQLRGAWWSATSHASLLVYPAGAGKTLTVILGLASVAAQGDRGGALVLCPARARPVWKHQWAKYTGQRAFCLMPAGMAHKEEFANLAQYLTWCSGAELPPMVIVGAESVADHLDDLMSWCMTAARPPTTFVVDEGHEVAGDPKRYSAVARADGRVDFNLKVTARSGAVKRNAAAMVLSRMKCFARRVETTATPFGEGRPRRLFGVMDVVWPGAFGMGTYPYAKRYCNAMEGEYALDDTGSSNLEELRARASFFIHEVPYSESHKDLPPLRVEVPWLSTDMQERGKDKELHAEASAAMKALIRGFTSADAVMELRLAEAAAAKRPWIVRNVMEALRGGPAKIVVFANRHQHVERWAKDLGEAIERANGGDAPVGTVHQEWGHGDNPAGSEARYAMAQRFADLPGPCVFVVSGQAFGSSLNGFEQADLAIIAALPWRADELVQWRGRLDRHGGRPTRLLIPLASGTYDEEVADILINKLGPIETFLSSEETAGLREKFSRAEDAEEARREVLAALGVHLP